MPRLFADAAGGVNVGMRAYTAVFPGGAGIQFDHAHYRDEHLAAMQRLYAGALARVEMRKPLVATGEPPSPYAAIVNFWLLDAELFAKASAAHGRTLVEDKAHFTNSEQKVQSEVVFGEAGKPASAVHIGDRCLTVLYPHDPAGRFDYEYYLDHHMTWSYARVWFLRMAEIRPFMPARRTSTWPMGLHLPLRPPRITSASSTTSPASRRSPRFSVMTEVLGAFDT